jgi:carbonic anhydrase/acetyltransferase-like protein (isoleucine patch superfamily)
MLLKPNLSRAAFVAPDAVVIGDVQIADKVSIWYTAVIRADLNSIHIGACSNIQDGAVLHGDPGLSLEIEDHVTVGHRAVIHGLYVGHGSL